MNADNFVKAVREGNEKFRVDNVVLDTGEQKLRGRGLLRLEKETLEIDLTLDAGREPKLKKKIVTRKDFWQLSGIINNHLRFRCAVGPGGRSNSFNGIVTITRNLHPIELEIEGFDALSLEQRKKAFKKIMAGPDGPSY